MKIKNFVAILITGFMLVSCMPAAKVVPTETAIPAFTPKVTVTLLPTATSTPDYTPTPTPIPQVWIDSVHKIEGGWKIDNVNFEPNRLVSFPPSYEAKVDDFRRFGTEGQGQVNLQCYGEIILPSGQTVITGFLWWQNTRQVSPIDWEGVAFSLGIGIAGGTERGQPFCINSIKGWLENRTYSKSFNLIFSPNQTPSDSDLGKVIAPLVQELPPPTEFWITGDINLLPKIDGKPFLFATNFEFIKDE